MSRASSGSQSEPQITLMTFQPAPRKAPSSSWMILPLPRTGPSSRCRLQLMTKIRLSSCSRRGQRDGPQRLGLVAFAVAQEGPDPRRLGVGLDAAIDQVMVEPGLVDGHDRPQAHRHRGKLPEVGHQPGMRIATTARRRAANSRRKFFRCSSLEPAQQERPGVDARRGVALEDRPGRAAVVPSLPWKKWLKATS